MGREYNLAKVAEIEGKLTSGLELEQVMAEYKEKSHREHMVIMSLELGRKDEQLREVERRMGRFENMHQRTRNELEFSQGVVSRLEQEVKGKNDEIERLQ